MKKTFLLFLFVGTLVTDLCAQSLYPGQYDDKVAVKNVVPIKAYAFPLDAVTMLDSPFKANMEREEGWLMSIPVSSLLYNFRHTAGIQQPAGANPMGGGTSWENMTSELRGHAVGHYLSGMALLYASTKDDKYKIKADSIVQGLREVEQALDQKGYLSAYPQYYITRAILRKSVWAPWYTLHKILSGLIDQYLYCDNLTAFELARGMGDWAYERLSSLSDQTVQEMLSNEFGGMNDALYNLYSLSGDPRHKKVAEMFYHHAVLDPLEHHEDCLSHKHANTFIPKIVGEARSYELTGNSREESIAEYFWNTVVEHHTFVTGSNSQKESFFDADQISKNLTAYTGESCNTYNMLKLTRHLFCWEADARYADYYERALYNHILGQQDPSTGAINYFLALEPGAFKLYGSLYDSYWCCIGSSFENQAKYGEAIYYHTTDNLFVNLYIPSMLDWKEQGVRITMQNDFPSCASTVLTVNTAEQKRFTLKLRYPEWAVSGAQLRINGRKTAVKSKAGSYIDIERTWRDGDKIEITYPMSLRAEAANDSPDMVALTYGPFVLAGEMGTEGIMAPHPYTDTSIRNEYYNIEYNAPASLSNKLDFDPANPSASIKLSDPEKLKFTSSEGVTLSPLYNIHHQRYVVYWDIK